MHANSPPPYEPCRTGHRGSTASAREQASERLPCEPSFMTGHFEPNTDSLPNTNTSLDFTQRIERKLAEYNSSENAFKRWLFEIICWLVSALAMGATISIYAHLNEKPMAQAGNLLTYTNALGKIASAALIVPTSEALGQLKWNWFSKSRAMWDFEIFDKASRGPLGAVLLLFRTKGRSLAALGAILIVLLLAIDTFFQQVVTLPNRGTLQHVSGTLPRVINYKPIYTPAYYFGFESTTDDRAIAAVGREFLYGNGTQPVPFGSGTRPDIPLTCPTGDCSWPLYETLATCSKCSDVSDTIGAEYACLNTAMDWSGTWEGPRNELPYPNGTVCGHFINATSVNPILLSGYALPLNGTKTAGEALLVRAIPLTDFDTKMPHFVTGSINYTDVRLPILDVLISTARDGAQSVYTNEMPLVHECVLAWCVQTLKSSYARGVYDENIVSTYFEPVKQTDTWPWITWNNSQGIGLDYRQNVTLTPPYPRAQDLDVATFSESYGVLNYTQMNVMWFFDDFFPSFYTVADMFSTPKLRFKNYEPGSWVQELRFNPWQHPNNISRHMERMARAMTNVIRSSESKVMLDGQAYQTEPYIFIQWGWLAFPLTLLVLSLVFLVSTIIKTSGDSAMGIWKNSAMPTLIYSLPKETQTQFVSSSAWSSDQGASKKTRIRMLPNMGWRVSGHSYSPRLPSGERVPRGWI